MHHEHHVAETPDASDPDVQYGVAAQQISAELRRFLTEQGHCGGLGWFRDTLGFTTFSREAMA